MPDIKVESRQSLRRCELFEPLSDAQIEELGSRGRRRVLVAGEMLLSETAAGYAMMKKIAGLISMRLRDLKEEFVEALSTQA